MTVLVPTVRLYCEMIPAVRLVEPVWLRFLHDFCEALQPVSVELVVKVLFPAEGGTLDPGTQLLLARRAALPVSRLWLWGQLRDRDAIYLNATTLSEVDRGWARLLAALDGVGYGLEGALLDLEPDLRHLEGLYRLEPAAWMWLLRRLPDDGGAAVEATRNLLRTLEARAPVVAAAPPTSVLGPLARGVERRLGVPVHGVGWPEITEMTYTSFLLPTLTNLVGANAAWRAAGAIAGVLARAHVRGPGRRSVLCGTCGVGVLGDEPCFPHAEAMRPQVRSVARARPHALGVFNLLGLVSDGRGYRPGLTPDEERWRTWATMLLEELAPAK